MNLLAYLNCQPLAMLPRELNKMRAMLATADFNVLKADYETHKLKLEAEGEPPKLKNGSISQIGVAVINIKGALFNVESYFDEILAYYFGGTSYQSLMRDIDAVTNNPLVQAVGFYVHTPGGTAFGMNETANKIAALTAKKPTIGYAYGLAASAGFGLISACGEVYADASALLGSIGVVTEWADFTGFYENLGIAWEEVTSSNARFKRLDIRKDEDRAVLMSEIDGVENVFLKFVSKARKVSIEKVKSDFGQGAVMVASQAKSAGMIDGVSSWDEVLKQLQTKAKKANRSASAQGDKNMNLLDKFNTWLASDEVKPLLEAGGEPTAGTSSGGNNLTAEAEKLRADAAEAELAQMKKSQTDSVLAQIPTDTDAFIEAECKAGRLFPAEKATFKSLYTQAATDDANSPLAEGSRLDALKANQQKRMGLNFTQEVVDAEANERFIVKVERSAQSEVEASAEQQAANYVAQTGGGKAGLKAVK